MSRGKRVILWVVILVVAAAAGFGVAALTYEPPDPEMEQGTTPQPAEQTPASPLPDLVTVSPARER